MFTDDTKSGRTSQSGSSNYGSESRRAFLRAAVAAPVFGSVPMRRSSARESPADSVSVTAEAELVDALGEYERIRFADDVTVTEPVRASLGTTDTTLDLNEHTFAKADGTNAGMLALRTEGNLTVRNGLVDCNRRGQNFPADKSKEVQLFGGRTCRLENMALVDNSNYGFAVEDFDEAIFENPIVDSRPHIITETDNAAGLDGIHTFDCSRVSITKPRIKSGDDAVAIAAKKRNVEKASILGGSLSSPVHANGVRLHVQSGATSDATVNGVLIDTDIHDCRGQGVVIANESKNGNAIRDVTVGGTIRKTRDGGVRAFDRVDDLTVTARISDSGANGVNIEDSGRNVTIMATIERAAVNGIRAVDARNVTVVETAIRNCDNWPIISGGRSNHWTVVNNEWRGNRFSSISLANENNLVMLNKTNGSN